MNTRIDFGQKIIEARKIKDITQQQLSEKANITQNNLSRIEAGKYNPGLDILFRIADALGMELTFE